jgi:hypothetical protein
MATDAPHIFVSLRGKPLMTQLLRIEIVNLE